METKPSILIIEDDPGFLIILDISLSRVGLECSKARSVHEALSYLEKELFDLILLDLYLDPEINEGQGTQIIRWIRERKVSTKIIVYSGYLESLDSSLRQTVFDVISKSESFNVLLSATRKAIGFTPSGGNDG